MYKLKDYQKEALEFILKKPVSVLDIAPGLGKCFISLFYAKQSPNQIVILATKNSLPSWVQDLEKLGLIDLAFIGDKNKILDLDKKILVILYSRLDYYKFQLLDINKYDLILDEIDNYCNPTTKVYKNIKAIIFKANRIIGVTGTGLFPKLEGVYNLFSLLFRGKNPLGSNFYSLYTETKEKKLRNGREILEIVKYKNLNKFASILRKYYYSYGISRDIRYKFPSLILSREDYAKYRHMARQCLKRGGSAKFVDPLQNFVNKASNKPEVIAKYILSHYPDKPIIVYGERIKLIKSIADILYKNDYPCDLITGNTPISSRKAIVEKIRPDNPQAILITYSGIRGINMQQCRDILLASIPQNFTRFYQLLGRVTRIGSPYPYNTIVFFRVPNTIDEYKVKMLSNQLRFLKEILKKNLTIPSLDIYLPNQQTERYLKNKYLWCIK